MAGDADRARRFPSTIPRLIQHAPDPARLTPHGRSGGRLPYNLPGSRPQMPGGKPNSLNSTKPSWFSSKKANDGAKRGKAAVNSARVSLPS